MPTTGPLRLNPGAANALGSGYRSRFSHEREEAHPGYYAVTLDDYRIRAELTASERVGFHRYTFPGATMRASFSISQPASTATPARSCGPP